MTESNPPVATLLVSCSCHATQIIAPLSSPPAWILCHILPVFQSQRHTNPAVTTRNQATVWADRQVNHIPTRVVPSESFLPVLPELVSCSIYHDLVIHRLEDILSTWMRRRTSQRVHARVRNEFDQHRKVVCPGSQAVGQDQTLSAIRHPLYPPGGTANVLALAKCLLFACSYERTFV
jgi:hypothetical protein